MQFRSALIFIIIFSVASLFAQSTHNELVVKTNHTISGETYLNQLTKNKRFSSPLKISTISENRHLYLIRYEGNQEMGDRLINELEADKNILFASFNLKASIRQRPNDDYYASQRGHYELIEAHKAWDFTTGGVTALGDTIVIAVMEAVDVYHEDLQDNIWRNRLEIPDNDIDDDNNGYIDDYVGYNVTNETDEHNPASHGTKVCGIIGAKGNNQIGVTGVAWNNKLMVVSSNLTISEILQSYEYVLQQRKDYNESNGAKGAFIVATNASFGFDERFPDDNPLFQEWCNLLQDLGEVGILSVVATNNSEINIDERGDVPSFCSTDYIIAVTDTDAFDQLKAAYSSTHIDLSAPGAGSYSTKPNNDYGNFNGTSAATPHVSGTIGLLYSLHCDRFARLTKQSPSSAALAMKQFILNGVDPVIALSDKTTTGGRLNIHNALNKLQQYCNSENVYSDELIVDYEGNSVLDGGNEELIVKFSMPANKQYTYSIYDPTGKLLYQNKGINDGSSSPLRISTARLSATGLYFLSIDTGHNIQTLPFIVY